MSTIIVNISIPCSYSPNAMKLSTRCRYGSRALIEIARNYGQKPTKRKEICRIQGLSNSYIENILISLKSAGIVDTIRGARGGYVLVRPPSQITLLDVTRALEGSQAPVECLDNPVLCERSGRCATQDVWREVQEAEEKVLKKTTISALLQRERKFMQADYAI